MSSAARAKKPTPKTIRPKKSGQIPATSKMLARTRAELKSNITTVRLEMRAGFKKLDARMDARFNAVDARFKQVDAKFDALIAKMDKMAIQQSETNAKIERALAIYEEQDARNKFVLDGYSGLDFKLDKIKKRLCNLEDAQGLLPETD